MAIPKDRIDYNYETGKYCTLVSIMLDDGNPMFLKARAELYINIMDGITTLIDAKIAEFTEVYGQEVIQFAHGNIGVEAESEGPSINCKVVDSREVGRKLLKKTFPEGE